MVLGVQDCGHVCSEQTAPYRGTRILLPVHNWCEFYDASSFWITLEDEMKHRHEVTLSAPETPMQVGSFAGVGLL